MKNLLSIVIVIFLVSCERRLEFDKNYWKNHPNKRYKMADDIVKTKMLIGKNKQDVRVLLTKIVNTVMIPATNGCTIWVRGLTN